MTDDELFARWWTFASPPGTFDKEQCRTAFLAGLEYQRSQAVRYEPIPNNELVDVPFSLQADGRVYRFDFGGDRYAICEKVTP